MNTNPTTVIDRIDAALDMTGAVVGGITGADLHRPSLCPGWDLRTELNHLVGGLRIFAAELTGIDAGRDHHDDWLEADHRAAFATAADLDRAAWHRPGALDTTIRLGFGPVPSPMAALIHLTEILVHGTDIAVVTGRQHLIDEDLCQQLLTTMRSMDFSAFRRPGMFADEQPAPENASNHQRLLAFLGRHLD
ncbi:TIGR03086 family metal-binding protein [Nocardia xishanensis]|uniref:TIGR03086 family metal-binding protein n=1 Tax=Nocardia xishanensis TaxID=238964 RepID=UPI0034466F77